ncbi:MAG: hypothetical protein N4A45_00180 [Flavobacteriales bacterium]|jgi:hypothetical protein|nr:hypothetical protein [Flavobacteriales bacterium]
MKGKSGWIIFGISVVLLLGLILLINPSKDISWVKHFKPDKKTPYGTYIAHKEAQQLFSEDIEIVSDAKYFHYQYPAYSGIDSLIEQSEEPFNLVIVTNHLNTTYEDSLLQKVEEGKLNLFIAASDFDSFEDYVSDQIYFTRVDFSIEFASKDSSVIEDGFNKFVYTKNEYFRYLENGYLTAIEPLLFEELSDTTKPVIQARIQYGKGQIIFNSYPFGLSNYELKKEENSRFLESSLGHLPDLKTYWVIKGKKREVAHEQTALSYILNQEKLKYSWYLLLIGIALYFLNYFRREQNIIPELKKPINRSKEYIHTMASLYFDEGNVIELQELKANYFLEQLKKKFYIHYIDFSEESIQLIHQKTQADIETITLVINNLKSIRSKKYLSENQFIYFSRNIDKILNE